MKNTSNNIKLIYSLNSYFTSSTIKTTVSSYKTLKSHLNSLNYIQNEFSLLQKITDNDPLHLLQLNNKKENLHLNKYSDIVPYKHNEIELSDHNYINASYINVPFPNSFIATQAPIKAYNDSFYQMIIEKNVSYIFKLNGEETKESLNEYWKNSTNKYSIQLVNEIEYNESILIKKFTINKGHNVTAIIFLNWKDHSSLNVSKHYDSLINIFHVLDDTFLYHNNKSPVIVHCNAGVGRTGTLIAMYILYYELCVVRKEEINIWNLVRKLKEMRRLMVENESQYKMIYQLAKIILKKIILNSVKKDIQ